MTFYDRQIFFDAVRKSLFGGSMDQSQVDGMNYILGVWEAQYPEGDVRHASYCLATTFHETAQTMQPIEEYGQGAGKSYGIKDPQTKQTYYGRGYVQLTWRENYARADLELMLSGEDSCEWHAEQALDPVKASAIMFLGMLTGWFRSDSQGPQNLWRYFQGASIDDPYGAREIINGDKTHVPSWSNGVSIGNLVKGYHEAFLAALKAARRPAIAPPAPEEPAMPPMPSASITVIVPRGVQVKVIEED